ncbi:MAG: glutathione peroxidase [Planctomycetota bacterium]
MSPLNFTAAVAAFATLACGAAPCPADAAEETKVPAVLDFEMKTLKGEPVKLCEKYAGKVVLFVNVASRCGLTPQYEPLQELHEKYAEKGLAIVGVPCNQFGGQEPGTPDEIAAFCQDNYGVEFDMLEKVNVKSSRPNQCPLYKFLTSKETNPGFDGDIQWNFEKFLVSRDGKVVNRFSPRVRPDDAEVTSAVEAELAKK